MRLEYNGNMYTYLQPYIAKYNSDNLNKEILYFNEYNELCFQNDFKSKVLLESEYTITIFKEDHFNNIELMNGKLIRTRDELNKNEYYIFKNENIKKEFKALNNVEMIYKVILEM